MSAETRYLIEVPGRKMRPTLKHRPAIWENMLGTVYAMNDKHEVRYFDYNYTAAMEFAGVSKDERLMLAKDNRIFRFEKGRDWCSAKEPIRNGKTVLFVLEAEKK